jgi:hypothetical protein
METTNRAAACAEANARQQSRGMHHYVIESKGGTQFAVISADEMRRCLALALPHYESKDRR